jgi:hypothetical protein
MPRSIVPCRVPERDFPFDAGSAEAPIPLAVAAKHERKAAMSALCKLSSSCDYSQELQGENLKHAGDGKRSAKPVRPSLTRLDFHTRNERHSGEFQPRRDAVEQILKLVLSTLGTTVSQRDRVKCDVLGFAREISPPVHLFPS